MRFWDASAVVPLLHPEPNTDTVEALQDEDPELLVWTWTSVECLSALARLHREGRLTDARFRATRRRLEQVLTAAVVVVDVRGVAARAMRCLLIHPLRAADAGQLGAALLANDRLDVNLPFVTFDHRLARAADREGLRVLGVTQDDG